MNSILRISAVVLFSSLSVLTQPVAAQDDHRPITIRGCVVAGERANQVFLKEAFFLKDVRLIQGTPPAGSSADSLFLRLDTREGLKENVGHVVEVSGIADFGDIDKGTLELRKEPGDELVTVSLNSERRTVRAEVKPTDKIAAGVPVGTSGRTRIPVPTYKLQVQSVKRASSSCS